MLFVELVLAFLVAIGLAAAIKYFVFDKTYPITKEESERMLETYNHRHKQ